MGTHGHRATILASEYFARAAEEAAVERRYALAALLYWAAAMVLGGHPVGEVELMLWEFSASTPALIWRGIRQQGWRNGSVSGANSPYIDERISRR
jgi:hypothetical protein